MLTALDDLSFDRKEVDFSDAAVQLKTLGDAEARQRQSLPEYRERTSLEKIPLLAIDLEPHELGQRQGSGVWSLNHGPLDQFASEFLELGVSLGKGLPGRPRGIDPLTFLLHNVSLFLWITQDRENAGFKYLYLLNKPLANNQSIKIRQIVSLIKAVELYARYVALSLTTGRQGYEPQDRPAPPWQVVDEAKFQPGLQEYPKWVHQPDGRHRIVSAREEEAALFTADWITKGIVTGPVDTNDVKKEGAAAKFGVEPTTVDSRTSPGERTGYVELLREILPKKNDMTIEGWANLHGFARTTVYTWKKLRLAGSSLEGRLSTTKCEEIEKAIRSDAEELGLPTRTCSY
jgi:hypothetical protein